MTAFDSFVTSNFDALAFGSFFACLFVLGTLEFAMSRTPHSPRREVSTPTSSSAGIPRRYYRWSEESRRRRNRARRTNRRRRRV